MSLLIKGINLENTPVSKRAAMYFKTEPFFVNVEAYTHTNNWEILQAIRLLNKRGYTVDLIDRKYENWRADSSYDLFLGLGVGNRGKNFPAMAASTRAPTKILLAMGLQPDLAKELITARFRVFNERTKLNAIPERIAHDVTGDKFSELIDAADYIFNIGEEENPSYNSYLPYGLPVVSFLPSTSPKVNYNSDWLCTRNLNSYLCFAGNGLIGKGVDVVVESFLKDPTKELHICGPPHDVFFSYYGEAINASPNIHYHGFIEPGELIFNQLASRCAFVVFHSASEGCCTSVATAMRAGLVPIVNARTGIMSIEDIGIELSEEGDIIQTITDATTMASSMDPADYSALVQSTLQKSLLFSQESFTKSYGKALDKALKI